MKTNTGQNIADSVRKLRESVPLARQFTDFLANRVISDYREFLTEKKPRRALLSYLVHPLMPPPRFRDQTRFTNRGNAQVIPRILNEMGYVVDIVNFTNTSWIPTSHYDLFIGHGGINFEHISRYLSVDVVKIYLSAGLYWKELNRREAERYYWLAERRGYFLNPDRAVFNSEEYANREADAIITYAYTEGLSSFSKFPCVFGLRNAAFSITFLGCLEKDYEKGRNHFLFFSGGGNVHKGLDLLLEAFAGLDFHLHICQVIDSNFMKVYQTELTNTPNIHLHNFIKLRSNDFYALINQCNWIISATCGDGCPGAILETMAHGLIPVIPNTANIELGDWGLLIPDFRIDTIRSVITKAAGMSAAECKERAVMVKEVSAQKFSVPFYVDQMKNLIEQITS